MSCDILDRPPPPGYPTMFNVMSLPVPVMRHVPAGSRTLVGQALGKVCGQLVVEGSWEALLRFTLFAKYVLRGSAKGGKRHRSEALRLTRERAMLVLVLDPLEMWEDLRLGVANRRRPLRENRRAPRRVGEDGELREALDEGLLRTVRTLVGEGAYGKANDRLTSGGMHDPNNPEVQAEMRKLHPTGAGFISPGSASIPVIVEDSEPADASNWRREALLKGIKSFSSSSAGGPSGLRPQHLREMVLEGEASGLACLLDGLERLLVSCVNGSLPPQVMSVLCAARLFPLIKKSGGIRPIAVSDSLRRLMEKVMMAMPETRAVCERLLPVQCGFGAHNACEQIALFLQSKVNANLYGGRWVLVQLDVINAFNTGKRAAIVEAVRTLAPHLLPWACGSLQPNNLLLGETWLVGSEGTQQGAPLSPLLFSLLIQGAVAALPVGVNVWYLDDGTLLCSVPEADSALRSLLGTLSPLGAQLSLGPQAKTTVWGPGLADDHSLGSLPDDSPLRSCKLIPYTPDSGVKVLGLPIHHPEGVSYVGALLGQTLAGMEECMGRIGLFPDPQIQHCLLRTCADACKVNFLLRGSESFLFPELLSRSEASLRSVFSRILGAEPLTDPQWEQVCLPMRLGGAGVRSPTHMAGPARISALMNWHQRPIAGLQPPAGDLMYPTMGRLLATLVSQVGPEMEPIKGWLSSGRVVGGDACHADQRWWSDQASQRRHLCLLDTVSGRDLVRLDQQSGSLASGWMAVSPAIERDTRIAPSQYRCLLRWHLGIPLLPPSYEGTKCPMGCGELMDVYGDHLVSCRRNKQWERHSGVQTYLGRCLRAHCLPHRLEEAVDNNVGNGLRTDVTLCRWDRGADLALDIAVCHPCPLSMDVVTTESARSVLANRSTRKLAKYQPTCAGRGQTFSPFVLSTWGLFAPGAGNVWQEMVRKMGASRSGSFRMEEVASLHQGLSMALMKGIGNQLAAMGLSTEMDPVDALGNERKQATKKRDRSALQKLVTEILADREVGHTEGLTGSMIVDPAEVVVLPSNGMDDWVADRAARVEGGSRCRMRASQPY